MPQDPKINWDDLPDIDLTDLPDSDESDQTKPSLLSRGWKAISEPLTDYPSRFMKSVGSSLDEPTLDRSVPMAQIRGFGRGALEGIGDLASGLTSPVNIATTLLSGGSSLAAKGGMAGTAAALSAGAKLSAVPGAIHGGYETLRPDATLGERGIGLTELAGNLLPFHEAPKIKGRMSNVEEPVISPVLEKVIPNGLDLTGLPDPPISDKIPVGQTFLMDPTRLTEGRRAELEGGLNSRYEFLGVNDQGKFRLRRIDNNAPPNIPPTNPPGNIPPSGNGGMANLPPSPPIPPNPSGRGSTITDIVNFPRSVMASWDLSAPLRQGLPLVHKKEWWGAWDGMFKSLGSETAFDALQQEIGNRPLFRERVDGNGNTRPSIATEAGLHLTDLNGLTHREESMMSTLAERIPGVRASNRAYTGFLNKLRADTFQNLVQDAAQTTEGGSPALLKELANFVNVSTGRGSLGSLERSAGALNSLFFSPRLIASRLTMLNPNYYIMANPMVRKEALKSLFTVAAAGSTITQLGKLAGGTVESDPTSSDFGKLKVGNTRLDPYGGFQQYIVAANRLMQGRSKSSTSGKEYKLGEKFGAPTRLDVAGRFAESKLNPVMSFVTGILRGKNMSGEPFNVKQEIASRFVPIFLQDLKQLATEDPSLISLPKDFKPENLPFAAPAMFGMTVQNY